MSKLYTKEVSDEQAAQLVAQIAIRFAYQSLKALRRAIHMFLGYKGPISISRGNVRADIYTGPFFKIRFTAPSGERIKVTNFNFA